MDQHRPPPRGGSAPSRPQLPTTRHRPPPMELVEPRKLGLPGKPMVDTELVQDALRKAEEWGNVLLPVTYIDRLPPMHEVSLRIVFFDPHGTWSNRSNGLWYELKGGKIGLCKGPLLTLWRMAGGEWWPPGCYREDDGTVPLYWRYRASGTIRGWTGAVGRWTCARERDLRDGAPTAKAMVSDEQRAMARQFGGEACETMAMLRVVRAALNVRGGYTREEAERPFILPVLQFAPDLTNPEIARQVVAHQLAELSAVYGGAPKQITERMPARDFAEEARRAGGREPVPAWQEAERDEADEDEGPPPYGEPPGVRCIQCGASVSEELEAWCASKLADGEPRCRPYAAQAKRREVPPPRSNARNSGPERGRGGGR